MPVSTKGLTSLTFAVRATQAGQSFSVQVFAPSGALTGKSVTLADHGGDPVMATFTIYDIPLDTANLDVAGQDIGGFYIQDLTGAAQPVVFVDDVGFRGRQAATAIETAAAMPLEIALPFDSERQPLIDPATGTTATTPDAAGTTAFPGTIVPVRSAEQLRADLRHSQSLDAALKLDLTETITLSRLLAIDDALEKITDHYGTDYLWSLAMMMAESNLDPAAQGQLVDDRGLGQIGFGVERVGKMWGSDRTSPYYFAEFDPQASVWEPKTNMIYQAIWFRNILTFGYVRSFDQTYALYTKGLNSVDPETGAISERAQADVNRARSYIPLLEKLLFLKDQVRQQQTIPATVSPLVGQLLEIDRTTTDGIESYRTLRDLFIDAGADGSGDPFAEYTYLHEAINYTDLLDRGYKVDPSDALKQIKAVMDRRAGFFKNDGTVAGAFSADLTKVTERLAALTPKRPYVVVPGDSYIRIAERFAVDINDMLRLNNRTVNTPLYPRDVLRMPSYRSYRVRQDDGYSAIAQAFAVDRDLLLRINGRTVDTPLLEGEVLEIPSR